MSLFSETGFASPNQNGYIPNNLGSAAKTYRSINSEGDGYSFKVGYTDKKLVALSGVNPGTDPGETVKSGKGTYYGTFVLGGYEDVKIKGRKLNAEPMGDAGTLVLEADFDKQTLRGTGKGLSQSEAKAVFGDDVDTSILRGGTLKVDGKIQGKAITGQVTYDGTQGALKGVIGTDQAVGAYHGKGNETVYAGGFSTDTDISAVAETFCTVNNCQNFPQN